MSLAAVVLLASEEGGEHEVNQALSWGIGGLALAYYKEEIDAA